MNRQIAKILPLLMPLMLLSACGLKPLYAGGTQGAVAQNLGAIEISPMEGKAGWLMKNALDERLGAVARGQDQSEPARYALQIKLDDQIEGFGLVSNDRITQERRTLRARYQLVDLASGEAVLDATAGSDLGIDVVSSEYAVIAAEDSALEDLTLEVADQIVTRLLLYSRQQNIAATEQ